MSQRWRRRLQSLWSADDATEATNRVAELAQPLASRRDLDPLLARIGQARFVLLGEASHGTSDYYTWRAEISRRLIVEKGFSFIAVEGDWPDCYRVNRFVRGFDGAGESAREVLHNFERWPTWMWANHEVVELAEWLREHNASVPEEMAAGFYGLDVYSLWDSLHQILGYLQRTRPDALPAARRAFACFEPYGEDVQDYAAQSRWLNETCEDEVVAMLTELRGGTAPAGGGQEDQFNAEQNAWVVKNAEHYYRTMIGGGPASWNIRDRHMTQTLERLMRHFGPAAKAIVWEHNTHIGDARFTDMADDGMVNVGQLIREEHGTDDVVLVGFSSHRGSVVAGRAWEAPLEVMPVPPGAEGTWEDLLHGALGADGLLIFGEQDRHGPLATVRGHRAIGVVYHPEYERGNYVPTNLPRRYDTLLFLDQTHALHPLHEVQPREEGEVPETYPSGV
jgi:erythromycin esterase